MCFAAVFAVKHSYIVAALVMRVVLQFKRRSFPFLEQTTARHINYYLLFWYSQQCYIMIVIYCSCVMFWQINNNVF